MRGIQKQFAHIMDMMIPQLEEELHEQFLQSLEDYPVLPSVFAPNTDRVREAWQRRKKRLRQRRITTAYLA